MNSVADQMRWIHQWMPIRLDGSGTTRIRCMEATHRFFRFEALPQPSFNNPAEPDFTGGFRARPGRNSNVAVVRFRIAYEAWDGHQKPRMAGVSVLGPWLQQSYQVIHNHLIAEGVPYLYLCNKHGNPLSTSWSNLAADQDTRRLASASR